jgi:hypothetical protein
VSVPGWRRAAVLASVLVAAGSSVLAVTTSSSAATADLQFSADGGASWSDTAPASLFDPSWRAVPGDRLQASLLVRSTRDAPTVMMVAIADASISDPLFDEAITVQGDDGTGAGLHATRLSALAACDAVVPTRTVVAGQRVPIEMAVNVSPSLAGHQAENAVARFDLQIGLTDVGAPTSPNGCPVDPTVIAGFAAPGSQTGTGRIAYTGTDLFYPALAVAGSALVVGALLALAGRRRREEGGA